MAITDKFETLLTTRDQANRAVKARALIQEFRMKAEEISSEIQEIKDAGALYNLDVEIKQALNDGWTIVKDSLDEIENNTTLKELLEA